MKASTSANYEKRSWMKTDQSDNRDHTRTETPDVDRTVASFLDDRQFTRHKSLYDLLEPATPSRSFANSYSMNTHSRNKENVRREEYPDRSSRYVNSKIPDRGWTHSTPDGIHAGSSKQRIVARSTAAASTRGDSKQSINKRNSPAKSLRRFLSVYFGLNKKDLPRRNMNTESQNSQRQTPLNRKLSHFQSVRQPKTNPRYQETPTPFEMKKSASCMTLENRASSTRIDGNQRIIRGQDQAKAGQPGRDFQKTRDEPFNDKPSTPCLRGIVNLGNTCYSNSVLECLSACFPLVEYFVSNAFVEQLRGKTRKQLENSHNYGTGGVLTTQFADILKSLWWNEVNERIARDFHAVVRRFNADYRTIQQQDAHEFLMWLLDKIHEDLNTAVVRQYNDDGMKMCGSEEELAQRTQNQHLMANRSIVIDVFGAQFRSSIRCRGCHKETLRFDPYLCVPIQVPQDLRKGVYVTVAHTSADYHPARLVRYGLLVDRKAKMTDVIQCVSSATRVPSNRLVMCHSLLDGTCTLIPTYINVERLISEEVTAVEIPEWSSEDISWINKQYGYFGLQNEDSITIVFRVLEVNEQYTHKANQRFTQPLACVARREWSHDEIWTAVLKAMGCIMRESIDEPLRSAVIQHKDCRLCVVLPRNDDPERCEPLNHLVSMPFYTDAVERVVSSNRTLSETNSAMVNMCVEVTEQFVMTFMVQEWENISVDPSSRILDEGNSRTALTLTKCLDEFTSAENIDWKCSECGQNGGDKVLKFHSLPPVLVFHLKRFKQMADGTMMKLERGMDYPVERLDMSPYVYSMSSSNTAQKLSDSVDNLGLGLGLNNSQGEEESWKALIGSYELNETAQKEDCIYELFAVLQHTGNSMNHGHYTATTRNAVDGKWRCYDDRSVSFTDPLRHNNEAYLLFYQKKAGKTNRRMLCRPGGRAATMTISSTRSTTPCMSRAQTPDNYNRVQQPAHESNNNVEADSKQYYTNLEKCVDELEKNSDQKPTRSKENENRHLKSNEFIRPNRAKSERMAKEALTQRSRQSMRIPATTMNSEFAEKYSQIPGRNEERVGRNPQLLGRNKETTGRNSQFSAIVPETSTRHLDLSGTNQDLSGRCTQLCCRKTSEKHSEMSGRNEEMKGTNPQLSRRNEEATGRNSQLSAIDPETSTRHFELSGRDQDMPEKSTQLCWRETLKKHSEMSGRNEEMVGTNPQLSVRNRDVTGRNSQLSAIDPELSIRHFELSGRDQDMPGKSTQLCCRETFSEMSEMSGRNEEMKGRNSQLSGRNEEVTGRYSQLSATVPKMSARHLDSSGTNQDMSGKSSQLCWRETSERNSEISGRSRQDDNVFLSHRRTSQDDNVFSRLLPNTTLRQRNRTEVQNKGWSRAALGNIYEDKKVLKIITDV